jgi:hypothetical protein
MVRSKKFLLTAISLVIVFGLLAKTVFAQSAVESMCSRFTDAQEKNLCTVLTTATLDKQKTFYDTYKIDESTLPRAPSSGAAQPYRLQVPVTPDNRASFIKNSDYSHLETIPVQKQVIDLGNSLVVPVTPRPSSGGAQTHTNIYR